MKKPSQHSEKLQSKQTKNGERYSEYHKALLSPVSNLVGQSVSLLIQVVAFTLVIVLIIFGLLEVIIKTLSHSF